MLHQAQQLVLDVRDEVDVPLGVGDEQPDVLADHGLQRREHVVPEVQLPRHVVQAALPAAEAKGDEDEGRGLPGRGEDPLGEEGRHGGLGVDLVHAGEREGVPRLRRLGGEEHPPVLGDHAQGDELVDAPRGDRGGGRGEVGAPGLGAPADLVLHVGEQEHGLVDVLLDQALDEADAEALLLVEGLRDGAAELAVGVPGEAGGREREDGPGQDQEPAAWGALRLCGGAHGPPLFGLIPCGTTLAGFPTGSTRRLYQRDGRMAPRGRVSNAASFAT